jgi:hypothetical protein
VLGAGRAPRQNPSASSVSRYYSLTSYSIARKGSSSPSPWLLPSSLSDMSNVSTSLHIGRTGGSHVLTSLNWGACQILVLPTHCAVLLPSKPDRSLYGFLLKELAIFSHSRCINPVSYIQYHCLVSQRPRTHVPQQVRPLYSKGYISESACNVPVLQ